MMNNETISNMNCLGEKCPNHCCGAYGAVSEKFKRLGDVEFTEIILTDSDVEKMDTDEYRKYIHKGKDGIYRMNTAEDGTCDALKNGICSVYKARPSICAAYPLYIDMFAGLCYLNECPAFSSNSKPSDYKVALSRLLDIYQFWIDYYRTQIEKMDD